MTTYINVPYPALATQRTFVHFTAMTFDYPIRSLWATESISGTAYDSNGATVSGATMKLKRDVDDFFCATVTTDIAGNFMFVRDASDPYLYTIYGDKLVSGVHIHGASDPGNASA